MTLRPILVSIALCLLAGTATAQEREWTLDASDQDAYLIFGVPESDDVGISLWCPIRKGVVNVFVPEASENIEAGKQVTMLLSAGDETASFEARAEVNAEAGVSSIEAEILADHPILSAMEKADRFRVSLGADEKVFPLYEADVAGLMQLCRKD